MTNNDSTNYNDTDNFIKKVLHYYHVDHRSIKSLADTFYVSELLIKRILLMYRLGDNVNKTIGSIKAIGDSTINSRTIKERDELKDKTRHASGKITQDDFNDLLIDISLFERGRDIDDEK